MRVAVHMGPGVVRKVQRSCSISGSARAAVAWAHKAGTKECRKARVRGYKKQAAKARVRKWRNGASSSRSGKTPEHVLAQP